MSEHAVSAAERGCMTEIMKNEEAVVVETAEQEAPKKTTAKKAAAKKETVKKETVKKTSAKKTAKAENVEEAEAPKKAPAKRTRKVTSAVSVQFSGKSYTTEELVQIAKDVWTYDLGMNEKDFKTVELYVKPEESSVYYVVNGEVSGNFGI